MKILLLENVKGIGKKMEVKEVKDGYAKNFLIAKNLATPASGESLSIKHGYEESKKSDLAKRKEMSEKVKSLVLEFPVKVGSKGEVFESVSEKDIEKSLKAKGIDGFKINLPHHIKVLGEHSVALNFGKEFKSSVKIILKGK
ncbi:MAG: 50S ribosomal protein L9 [Candidatus Pacebacteria bacterium]|nr:50S ribosomal protein L9 [Candidatus Paceibacterota bacterium]